MSDPERAGSRVRTGSRTPGLPAIASRDSGRASRQRGADCSGALRVPAPKPAPGRAQTPDLRFSAPRNLQRLSRPELQHVPTEPGPARCNPSGQNCTYAGRFPARCRGNGSATERREGQASCSAITRRAERKKKAAFFSGAPAWWAGAQSQTSLVLETGKERGKESIHYTKFRIKVRMGGNQRDMIGEVIISQWFSNLAAHENHLGSS